MMTMTITFARFGRNILTAFFPFLSVLSARPLRRLLHLDFIYHFTDNSILIPISCVPRIATTYRRRSVDAGVISVGVVGCQLERVRLSE